MAVPGLRMLFMDTARYKALQRSRLQHQSSSSCTDRNTRISPRLQPTAMSRFAAAAVAALLVAVAARAALAQETYSSRFDATDLDAILADEGRVDQYVRCFLAQKDDDCDEVGRRVKAVLAEALTTDCAKCTERQKVGLPKTVRFLARERPDAWKQIQDKFDPKRAYAAAHPELSQ